MVELAPDVVDVLDVSPSVLCSDELELDVVGAVLVDVVELAPDVVDVLDVSASVVVGAVLVEVVSELVLVDCGELLALLEVEVESAGSVVEVVVVVSAVVVKGTRGSFSKSFMTLKDCAGKDALALPW